MFAKLKKRIQEEGGSVSDSEKPLPVTPLPGHASPVRRDSGTVSPAQLPAKVGAGNSLPSSPPSNDSSGVKDGPHDELVSALQKRNEQCKRMETKISELAATIKEKNKAVEKLESTLEKEQDAHVKRIEELQVEFQTEKSKMADSHQEEINKLKQEQEALQVTLGEMEEYRHKFYRREEENDEFQGLATQELAKVKHMLLNAQEDMTKLKEELCSKNSALEDAQSRVKETEAEIASLQEKLSASEIQCNNLQEETKSQAKIIETLTAEKAVFERRLNEVNDELTKTTSILGKVRMEFADVENEYRTMQRNTDIQKNKSAKLLEEKEDHILELQDRVAVLEQRTQDQCLTGDDRVKALETERDSLEQKLSEMRQHLSDVKSTWSDKITQLEEQVTHLNAKIVEDNEELANSHRAMETLRESFHKQVEGIRQELEDAEKRAMENWELANQKDVLHDKERQALLQQLSEARLEAVDKESQLRGQVASLESQLLDLQTARTHQHSKLEAKIGQLERGSEESSERELRHEKEIRRLESDHEKLQAELIEKMQESLSAKKSLEEKQRSEREWMEKASTFEGELQAVREQLNKTQKDLRAKNSELRKSLKEADDLLMRNAELSGKIKAVQAASSERDREIEETASQHSASVADLEAQLESTQSKLATMEKKVWELEELRSRGVADTMLMEDLQGKVQSLEEELLEKNRTLKKQEQMLKDLRTTLQRELKVQTLPNDEPVDLREAGSPGMGRKFDQSSLVRTPPQDPRLNPAPPHLTRNMPASLNISSAQLSAFVNQEEQRQASSKNNSGPSPYYDISRDREVNFQYLKHVVLKFMLSRESEAIQLIKAVSVLLRFTQEEQQLIKETLEWKRSWFGARPNVGKGQMSKYIPPSY